jgi:release factor glutamine methyltransferase
LLEEASGLDSAALLRELDQEAPPQAAARLESLVARRVGGEPLQHVLGHWGFRTLDVAVDSRVLVPRPETERVVEAALSELDRLFDLRAGRELNALDLGTGSGVIALSLVVERTAVRVVATDNDLVALEVAGGNLSRIAGEAASRVELRGGDWYGAVPVALAGRLDLIVSNPPYLAEHEWAGLDRVVSDFDPYGALVAGPAGLEAIAAIVSAAPAWLGEHGSVVVEIAPHQAAAALAMAREAGFVAARVEDDLAGRARVLVASR